LDILVLFVMVANVRGLYLSFLYTSATQRNSKCSRLTLCSISSIVFDYRDTKGDLSVNARILFDYRNITDDLCVNA
jgi:hypothetical protein